MLVGWYWRSLCNVIIVAADCMVGEGQEGDGEPLALEQEWDVAPGGAAWQSCRRGMERLWLWRLGSGHLACLQQGFWEGLLSLAAVYGKFNQMIGVYSIARIEVENRL